MSEYYIGTSGYHYTDWKGLFYPESLLPSKWLDHYTKVFNTVEINSSFYHMPAEKVISRWKQCTPPGFVFTIKASRFLMHIRRLSQPGDILMNFIQRLSNLGSKLHIFLYQLPPNLKRDDYVLEQFLAHLPSQYKHVFEFRNESWMSKSIYMLLDKFRAGFCIYNMPGYTTPIIQTADFLYVRLHGSQSLYSSSYSNTELQHWAALISSKARYTNTIYVYFNNDTSAYAVQNALKLRSLLGK